MKTIAKKEIKWTTGNGSVATVIVLLNDTQNGLTIAATYELSSMMGVGVFYPTDCSLPSSHPARKAGATNGAGMLVWRADVQSQIDAAIAELKCNDAWVAEIGNVARSIKSEEMYFNADAKTKAAMAQ